MLDQKYRRYLDFTERCWVAADQQGRPQAFMLIIEGTGDICTLQEQEHDRAPGKDEEEEQPGDRRRGRLLVRECNETGARAGQDCDAPGCKERHFPSSG